MFFTGALALDQGSFGWDDTTGSATPPSMRWPTSSTWCQDDALEIGRTHPFGARVSITRRTACMSGSTPIRPASEFVSGRPGDAEKFPRSPARC